MQLWMITANGTDDGAPLYLQADGRWTRTQSAGCVLTSESERDAALERARAQEREVCDPYAFTVEHGAGGGWSPISLRERIRANGPTISLVGTEPSQATAVGARG